MKQKAKFFIFCMIFVANAAVCQKISALQTEKPLLVFTKKPVNKLFMLKGTFRTAGITSVNNRTELPVSPGFYAANLGFFCKQEIKFEKATRIPFKFRLGSVQQCDWMEGKPNTLLIKQ
jgi:hypothetical protein